MSRQSVVPLLLSGARTIILTVADIGPVTTRWGPVVPKRATIADRYRTEIDGVQTYRGAVVELGQPVATGEITAVWAGGGLAISDTYTLTVTVFDGMIDSDVAYDAALARFLAVSDALETTWSYSGLSISQVAPPELTSFDLGEVAGIGAWTGTMEVRVTVERRETADLA